VEVTRILEVTPEPPRESRPRGGDTPGPIAVETVADTREPDRSVEVEVTVAPVVAPTEVPLPTLAPEPTMVVAPTESPPEEGAYVERALSGEFAGSTVTVMGNLFEENQAQLQASLASFQASSGINIDLQVTDQSLLDVLKARVAAGDAPDLAIMSSGLIDDLADMVAWGAVVDLNSFLGRDRLLQGYNPTWLDAATLEGPGGPVLAGLWSRTVPRLVVFYALDDFEAAGYQVPSSWAELIALSDQMVANGQTPWCIGIESGSGTGWVVHQWLEEMMLRTAALEDYDLWAKGELPFDSPQVKGAAAAIADVWFTDGYVHGGREAIATTFFMDATAPMFDEPAGCLMTAMGPWITSGFPANAAFGETYDLFPLPPMDPSLGRSQVVTGDVWAMFNDRLEVRAVMDYIGRGDHLRGWIEADSSVISPHLDSSLSWYPNAEARQVAEILLQAGIVRLPAIDRMLDRSLDFTELWTKLTAWVSGDMELDEAFAAIEASRP
jgi:alpha-glucoside transport system substrate-binding protein